MIKQALGSRDVNNSKLTWNRTGISVISEHVQDHVAPTDVDPGARLRWLPKIRRSSPKVKRTGLYLKECLYNVICVIKMMDWIARDGYGCL
nr:protein SABRE isoform X3 [Tanacetum cinerariifolium]